MIDFAPLASYALELLAVVITVFASWALTKLGQRFGVDIDERLDARLDAAIERGLAYGMEKIKSKDLDLTIDTKNEFVEEAANYVIKGMPKTIRKFGLTKERVREMVESRLAGNVKKPTEVPQVAQ